MKSRVQARSAVTPQEKAPTRGRRDAAFGIMVAVVGAGLIWIALYFAFFR